MLKGKCIRRKHILGFVLMIILFLGGYIYWDNNRVIIKKCDIAIKDLPDEFVGYKFLQISDLHGKLFGKNQTNILKKINSEEYDCILFTGDMNKFETSDDESSKSLFDLISGIKTEKPMFWVDGNTGPFACENYDGCYTGDLTEMGLELEKKGIKVLLYPEAVKKRDDIIWITPEICKSDIEIFYFGNDEINNDRYRKICSYGNKILKWYTLLNENQDVIIRVNHYPLQINMTQKERTDMGYLDYDLSIAGHYHGGQFRIPFFGALYIPSPTSGRGGYFPKQSEVMGLIDIDGMQQYVSAGLGASSSVPFLAFRLFNTPEINLICLTKE